MEVILLEKVIKLGSVGDVVNVKSGYARNWLIPQGKVLQATNENKAEFESRRAQIEKENKDKADAAAKEAKSIADQFVVIVRQAGEDGRLYGSVSARDIADEIAKLGAEIQRSQIALNNPIKYLGIYSEKVVLHPEVIVNVHVNVARSKTEAEDAKNAFLNPAPKAEDKFETAAKEDKPKKKAAAKEDEAASEDKEDK